MILSLNKTIIENLRKEYPTGTKVQLIKMEDIQAPPTGTTGIVTAVDSIGTIHVNWANGSTLGAVYGEDIIVKC